MPTVSQTFANALADRGIQYAFGIPGGPWIPYMDAMERRGIRFILTANEASAAFMADVCARITGIPAVCHGTFGPGATNLATGVCSAFLDRSPLIAVTTELGADMRSRTTQMNIDHQALFAPITKWTTRLSPETVAETVYRAVDTAMAEVPGPVHIGHPVDITDLPSDTGSFPTAGPGNPAPPSDEALSAAAAMLQRARKPIFAVGLTAARFRMDDAVRRIAERFGAPVVLTPMAKGLLSEDHPAYAGVLFHACSRLLGGVIGQADLVVGLGYDPVEFNYESWFPDAPLLHIDTVPADIDASIRLAGECVGDLAVSAARLADLPAKRSGWDLDDLADHRRRLQAAVRPGGPGFSPDVALDILRGLMPGDAVMTCDVGAHTHLIGQLWRTPAPGLQLMTNGGSSMGFGIPAAIAAKLCLPDRKVACVTGDGGFLMMAGELVTARRLGLDVLFVVLADRSLSLIEVKQAWRGSSGQSSILYEGGLIEADRIFGVPVQRADRPDAFLESVRAALSLSGPSVIEAVVDRTGYHHLISRSYR